MGLSLVHGFKKINNSLCMDKMNGNISSGTNTTEKKMCGLNASYDFHIRRNFHTNFFLF